MQVGYGQIEAKKMVSCNYPLGFVLQVKCANDNDNYAGGGEMTLAGRKSTPTGYSDWSSQTAYGIVGI